MAADRKQVMFVNCCLFLCQIFICVYGRKTRDMIYVDVQYFAPCIRRFNATHEIGCTSSSGGNTGVTHFINDTKELEFVLAGPHNPYIPIMTAETFNLKNVEALLESKQINGIIVTHSNVSDVIEEGLGFSPDRSCPNDNFGIYTENSSHAHCSDITWNPNGNSLNYMNLKVPVFALLDQTEVDFLIENTVNFNHPLDDGNNTPREYPLCAVELSSFMFGAKDTPTCIWRSMRVTGLEQTLFCDPLGGYNLWGVLKPTNKNEPLKEKSVVVAAAQLDSSSVFYDTHPSTGAENTISSLVTLLAAAHALGKLDNATKEDMKNIMFTFFAGETYDYIGSSRMVYDMQRDEFPQRLSTDSKDDTMQPALVNLTHVSHFVELRQMGLTTGDVVWAHSDPVSQLDPDTRAKTDNIVAAMKASSAGGFTVNTPTNPDQSLPPASFQRFLRENDKIPGIVLTDHDKEYANKYFNSRFDVPVLLDPAYGEDASENVTTELTQRITQIATITARTLYQLARPASSSDYLDVVADEDMVNKMLYCFLYRPNCTLFKMVASPDEADTFANTPYGTYVGVYDARGSVTPVTAIVRRLLAYFTGTTYPVDDAKDCKKPKNDEIYTYNYIIGPPDRNDTTRNLCLISTSQQTPAESPAFLENNKESWSSTEYSTWTESRWASYSARIFLKPSQEQESVIFSLGMIVLLISLTTSYFLNARASILFAPNRTTY